MSALVSAIVFSLILPNLADDPSEDAPSLKSISEALLKWSAYRVDATLTQGRVHRDKVGRNSILEAKGWVSPQSHVIFLESDIVQLYRKQGVTVFRENEESPWLRYGAPGDKRTSEARNAMALNPLAAPHHILFRLDSFSSNRESVKSDDGSWVLKGQLTEEGVGQFYGVKPTPPSADGFVPLELEGSFILKCGSDGTYELEIHTFLNSLVPGQVRSERATRTFKIHDIDAFKPEIPREVLETLRKK